VAGREITGPMMTTGGIGKVVTGMRNVGKKTGVMREVMRGCGTV